jgi:hypothetical protein
LAEQNGERHWYLGDGTKFAMRYYYWCDRVIIMGVKNHVILEDIKFSDFVNRIDTEDWEPEIPKYKFKQNDARNNI